MLRLCGGRFVETQWLSSTIFINVCSEIRFIKDMGCLGGMQIPRPHPGFAESEFVWVRLRNLRL